MPLAASLQSTHQVGGEQFAESVSLSGDRQGGGKWSVPAAKPATLTTRTDNDTGTLTLATGHGFVNGDVVDLYWAAGKRRGMTVGSATGTTLVADGGSGDNLPTAATALTVCKRVTKTISFVGDDLLLLLAHGEAKGTIVFASGADAELLVVNIPDTNRMISWYSGSGITNPLAGVTVAKVVLSHANTGAKVMKVGLLLD